MVHVLIMNEACMVLVAFTKQKLNTSNKPVPIRKFNNNLYLLIQPRWSIARQLSVKNSSGWRQSLLSALWRFGCKGYKRSWRHLVLESLLRCVCAQPEGNSERKLSTFCEKWADQCNRMRRGSRESVWKCVGKHSLGSRCWMWDLCLCSVPRCRGGMIIGD